jgi:hypothetical protein
VDSEWGSDLYVADPDSSGAYVNARPLLINTYGDESNPAMSPDGRYLIFQGYRNADAFGGQDLYASEQTDYGWSDPWLLPKPINSEQNDSYPSFSPDGRFFSSRAIAAVGVATMTFTTWSTTLYDFFSLNYGRDRSAHSARPHALVARRPHVDRLVVDRHLRRARLVSGDPRRGPAGPFSGETPERQGGCGFLGGGADHRDPGSGLVSRPQVLRRMGLIKLEDRVSFSPGFGFQAGSAGQPTQMFRGIQDPFNQKVLFLLDGVPYWQPSHSDVPLRGIPPKAIDHVELIRGPGSVIHGSNARGGVMKRGVTATAATFEAGDIPHALEPGPLPDQSGLLELCTKPFNAPSVHAQVSAAHA